MVMSEEDLGQNLLFANYTEDSIKVHFKENWSKKREREKDNSIQSNYSNLSFQIIVGE